MLLSILAWTIVAAAYVAWIAWFAFGGSARAQPHFSGRESVACLLLGLGLPLLIGGGIAATLRWPSWRTVELVLVVASGLGVVLSLIVLLLIHWGRGKQKGTPAQAPEATPDQAEPG